MVCRPAGRVCVRRGLPAHPDRARELHGRGVRGLQLGLAKPTDRRYLLANLVGAAGLLVVAVRSVELGFVITNGLWVVVSAAGLLGSARWLGQTRQ